MQYLEPILGGLAAFALGFLWYTALFGKAWQKESGVTDEQAQSGMALTHGLSFVMMCWVAFGLSTYMNYHELAEQTFTHGAFHGSMTALSFALPLVAINYLYQKRSLKMFLIDAGYGIAFFALAGGVVSVLKLGAAG